MECDHAYGRPEEHPGRRCKPALAASSRAAGRFLARVGLTMLFGLVLIVRGLFHLCSAVASSDASPGSRVLTGVIGLLGLVIALYALRHVDITVSALAVVLGIYFICDGVIRIFAAVDSPDVPLRAVRIVVGALAIIAGAIVLIWPHPSLLVIAVLVGVWIVTFGIFQIFLGIGIRLGAQG
jgi:uncharacterized membrane protein HdeD (DUF308 family)